MNTEFIENMRCFGQEEAREFWRVFPECGNYLFALGMFRDSVLRYFNGLFCALVQEIEFFVSQFECELQGRSEE